MSDAATTRRRTVTTTMQEGASSAAAAKSLSAGVEVGEISGKRLFVEFAAFGFFKRNCQLELRANGDSVISKGMVTPENGAWRIEVRVQYGATPRGSTSACTSKLFSEVRGLVFRSALELLQHMLPAVPSYEQRAFFCVLLLSPPSVAVAHIVTIITVPPGVGVVPSVLRLVPRCRLSLLTDTRRYSSGHRKTRRGGFALWHCSLTICPSPGARIVGTTDYV